MAKLKKVEFGTDSLLWLFRDKKQFYIENGFPEDTRIFDIYVTTMPSLVIIIESDSFEDIYFGEFIPLFTLIIKDEIQMENENR